MSRVEVPVSRRAQPQIIVLQNSICLADSHHTDSPYYTEHATALTEQDLYCHEILACQACVLPPPHPGQLSLYLCPDCAGPVTLERRLATLQRPRASHLFRFQ